MSRKTYVVETVNNLDPMSDHKNYTVVRREPLKEDRHAMAKLGTLDAFDRTIGLIRGLNKKSEVGE